MEKYLDKTKSPKERADDLLRRMSTSEKMAQLNCLFPRFNNDYIEKLKLYPHSSGHVSCLEMRNLESIEELVKWQTDIQKAIMDKSKYRIPAIFHMEGLSGIFAKEATSFPSGIARGSSFNPELEYEIGKAVGKQASALGISQVLAPVLDVSNDPRLGRYAEPYSEDPTIVASLGSAYTKGLQEKEDKQLSTESVAKHFLGFHRSFGGIHGTECEISESRLREIYGKPFQAAISENNLRGIMPCYNTLNGKPVSADERIMNYLLRDEMGFDGMTVADYGAVSNLHRSQKVAESFTEAGAIALSAGLDVELQEKVCYNEELVKWFDEGKVDLEILNKAVKRVLIAKFRMGLFENPFAFSEEKVKEVFSEPKNKELSLQSALESIVLLKNDGILPLKKDLKKIALIGYHASTARSYFSGYTHFSMAEGMLSALTTMAGLETSDTSKQECYKDSFVVREDKIQDKFDALLQELCPGIKSLEKELNDTLKNVEVNYSYGYDYVGSDCSHHDEALENARNSDIVIMTVGGKYGTGPMNTTSEGVDSSNINIPVAQEILIEKMSELGKPIVLIHLDGRPISSNAADKYASAILEAWSPAEFGSIALVDVLTGRYNPSGKLPVTIAYNSGQIPLVYNHYNASSYHQGESIGLQSYMDVTHSPRYYFGHGLTYTKFAYSNLKIQKTTVSADEEINICLDIQNIGDKTGTEIVQFYIKDEYARMTRPVMELIGFKRVLLEPEEKKTLIFSFSPNQTAYVNEKLEWEIEKGEIKIMIGSSSNDIRLNASIKIEESKIIDCKTRKFYSNAIIK